MEESGSCKERKNVPENGSGLAHGSSDRSSEEIGEMTNLALLPESQKEKTSDQDENDLGHKEYSQLMGTYFALPIPLADKHPNPNPSSSHSAKITPLIKAITWLTPYRLSFAVAFGLNVVGVALELSGHWSWAKSNLATLVVGNMLCAVGARSEWVLRLVYWLSVKVFRPRFFPLWMRVQIIYSLKLG